MLGSVQALLYTRVNILFLDLIITGTSIRLRDFSGIYKAQETDAFRTQEKISFNFKQCI